MHLHIIGYPVAVAVVLGASAIGLRAYSHKAGNARWARWARHLTHWLIFGAVACATVGVGAWVDAVAGLLSSGTGVVVLLILLLLSGAGFVFEVVLRHMHHHIRTPVISGVFGVTLMMAIGESGRLLSRAARSPGATAQALGSAVSQIKSGRAAAAVPPDHRWMIFGAGVAVFAAFLYVVHSAGAWMKGTPRVPGGRKGSGFAGGRELPGGGERRALPSGKG